MYLALKHSKGKSMPREANTRIPGVSITIREFGDGTRELRRVRFRQVHGH